jgi:hypothetical protein
MASIISAGTTSGTSLNLSGDTSGVLQLASNGSTTAVTISTGQVATFVNDAVINGLTVGKGGGAVSSNTAFGFNALTANEAGGTNNTAIGNAALDSNTTGDYNTALGDSALAANTTGVYNTAVGYQAKFTGTGGYNTCFGAGAGSAFSTGAENTLVGYYAGGSLTTGNKNLFIGGAQGNGSGGLITTGNSNTVIGSFSGNQGGLDIRTASNYIVLSDGDGNPRATCNNEGRWLINGFTVVDSARISVNFTGDDSIGIGIKHTNASATMMNFWNSSNSNVGSITSTGSNIAYNTSSDYRLKENIVPITGALSKLAQLKPCTYTWKSDGSDGQGFIAHELQEIFPDAVHGEKDAVNEDGSIKSQGIDTSFLVATLTAAIQELKAELDATKAEVAALKGAAL